MKILLAGEGSNELGGRSGTVQFRSDRPGVVEALLLKIHPTGWKIVDAIQWKSIKKFKPGNHRTAEERNVLGLCKYAKDRGVDVVSFVRDRDGDKSRQQKIEKAMSEIEEVVPGAPKVIGGMAIEKLEAWILALASHTNSESTKHPEKRIDELGIKQKDVEQMVEKVEKADLDKIPKDARSLHAWLERAREILGATD